MRDHDYNHKTITQGWRTITAIARSVAGLDRALGDMALDSSVTEAAHTRDLMLADQTMHLIRSRLDSEMRSTRLLAATSTDPDVLLLLHRQQVVRRLIAAVGSAHVDSLAWGREVLLGGDSGEDHGPRLRRGIRVVAGGAPGLGRRS